MPCTEIVAYQLLNWMVYDSWKAVRGGEEQGSKPHPSYIWLHKCFYIASGQGQGQASQLKSPLWLSPSIPSPCGTPQPWSRRVFGSLSLIKAVFAQGVTVQVSREAKAAFFFFQFDSNRWANFATLTTSSKVLLDLMTPMIPRIDRAKSAKPTKMPIQAAA